jgi:hypothetical protein
MTDDPFKNRPEDLLNRAIKAGVGSLPVVGGPIAEFITFVIGEPAQERRDDFMRDIYGRIVDLEASHAEFKAETLRANEQFQATFIQAAQLSMRTIQEEKREMLRNAVLNSATIDIDENVRQMFMQYIERMTPLHVSLLKLMDDPGANPDAKQAASGMMAAGFDHIVKAAVPQLRHQDAIADRIALDLNDMGLLTSGNLRGTVSGTALLQRRSSNLGRSFLAFISEPLPQLVAAMGTPSAMHLPLHLW